MGKASRRKRENRAGRREVLSQLRAEGIAKGMRVVSGHRGRKLSVALGELIRPYLEDGIRVDEYRSLVTIGALAWNIAVLPDTISDEWLQSLLREAGVSDTLSFRGLLEELKERRLRLFPNDRRFIVRTEVHEQSDGTFYLAVAAAAIDEGAAGNEAESGGA